MHAQYEQTCNRVPLHNRLEALLEETHIKLSSLVSDLLCTGARRLLKALANGETDPAALATLADYRLRAIPEQLRDALGACRELNPVYRRLLKAALEELERIEKPIGRLEQEMADLLRPTRIRSSAWRRCPVWAWIRRSRSWPQPAPVQRRFLRPKNFPRGSDRTCFALPGSGRALGGGARSGRGFGAAGHGPSQRQCSDVSFGQRTFLVGRRLPRRP